MTFFPIYIKMFNRLLCKLTFYVFGAEKNGGTDVKNNLDLKSAHFKSFILCVYDMIAVNVAFILAMLAVGETNRWDVMLERAIPVTAVFTMLFFAFSIYSSIWKYAGVREVVNAFIAVVIGGLSSVAIDIIMSYFGLASSNLKNGCFSATFYVIGTILVFMFIIGSRVLYRLLRRHFRALQLGNRLNRVMIVGAGDMGMIMISELAANNFSKGKPVVAVDDSPYKAGKKIHGVPVKGSCEDIPRLAEKYKIDTIILCIPSASAQRQTEILRIAVTTGCKLKTSPSLLEMYDKDEGLGRLRDVNIEDLLSRPEVKLNPDVCDKYLKDKVVMVTGGGGSIGSELCRQVAKYGPKTIIIFDIYENGAYLLKNQIDSYFKGKPEIIIRIGSVRDEDRLREVFNEFHPSVVFHAAAHKHVPLMEESPLEAVKNNIFGTYNLANVAVDFSVERFVSISTDKAVNPANVMGATKRVTEMIIQYFERKCGGSTIFAAVRFGNVLGSNGSVIPIFTEEIKNGDPVTVTHPDITRYFMTIPEAAQLVTQAGGLSTGGEIFVLDMGEPVKIVTLAENLIRLSGYKPYSDIQIEFTGLRPGEKLYEELVLDEESGEIKTSANDKIFVTKPLKMDDRLFEKQLERLAKAKAEEVREILKEIVPNFVESADKKCETVDYQ